MAKKILMVEDNAKARAIGKAKLVEAGYEVAEAGDGVEALKALENSIPDLILLDLMMPLMDGYKVLQVVKTNPRTRDVPVIILSGQGQTEEVNKGLKLGAADFLVKMRTTPKLLLEKVESLLQPSSSGPRPGPARGPAVPHYHLAVKAQGFDAARLAGDFGLPPEYHCAKCGSPLLLEVVPDFSHSEPWFTGHFICLQCR
jgi:CheY-like chemotaxis protein